jgi:hypothetical protein
MRYIVVRVCEKGLRRRLDKDSKREDVRGGAEREEGRRREKGG